jgi:hypothetical protein
MSGGADITRDIKKRGSMKLTFEVVVNEKLATLLKNTSNSEYSNKFLHSLVNEFESGQWMSQRFQSYIWDNITQSCLSHSEREALADSSYTKLVQAAKNLRLTDSTKDIGKGSELAEIILYGIMKDHYAALPVVPKIFYKQNTQDNAKGADSVHIIVEGDEFSLWYGEVKFYSSIEDARFTEIFKSLAESLDDEKMKKENRIVSNTSDLEQLISNKTMLKSIIKHLDATASLDKLKPKIHIPILLLHECKITKSANTLSQKYLTDIKTHHTERAASFFKKFHEKYSKKIFMFDDVKFHIILLPVPSKSEIVNSFITRAKIFRES